MRTSWAFMDHKLRTSVLEIYRVQYIQYTDLSGTEAVFYFGQYLMAKLLYDGKQQHVV